MRPIPTSLPRLLCRATLLASLCSSALGQGSPSDSSASREENAVLLAPFEVSIPPEGTYWATNTNSVTGTNLPLSRIPLDASVFNRALMDDLAVVDAGEMLTKIAGFGPPLIGAGEGTRGNEQGDATDFKNFSVRGLAASNQRRDGFIRSDGTTLDQFDIETVETIKGSQSLLYGASDAGGVINFVAKRALFSQNTAKYKVSADSEGSWRHMVDLNAGNAKFAFRAVGVKDDTYFWKPTLDRHHDGYFMTAAVRPVSRVTVRAEYRNFERTEITGTGGTIRAPLSLLTSTGERVDGQHSKQLVFKGEGAPLGFDWHNADSGKGGTQARHITHEYSGVSVEARVTKNFNLQLRYGRDVRLNDALESTGGEFYHPDHPSNRLPGQWAFATAPGELIPFEIGQEGFRVVGNLRFDLGKFSRHEFNFGYQALDGWQDQIWERFYETDANGRIIQDASQLNTSNAGRTVMPTAWVPLFSLGYGGGRWPFDTIVHPQNGKTYRRAPIKVPGYGVVSADNPFGVNLVPGSAYTLLRIDEDAYVGTFFSQWFKGRLDTMLGYRLEQFTVDRISDGRRRGPVEKDTLTAGAVFDIWKGLRGYYGYSTNAKVLLSIEQTDIYNNPLPFGEGTSNEVGFKFDLFGNRVSGNASYFEAQSENEPADLGARRNDVDPNGINGRNGGSFYSFSRGSRGYGVSLTARPARGWEMMLSYSHADGFENRDVQLPALYNDEFHTIVVGGATTVAIAGSGGLSPLLVPSSPGDPNSPRIPLTVAMMKDPASPYFATLDEESGQIVNAQALGLRTPGVGTGKVGLPISQHQLGFVAPNNGTVIVRKAGERTTGYGVDSFSVINRFSVPEGRLKGLAVGLVTTYKHNNRGYYYSDATAGGARRLLMYPDDWNFDAFATYGFKLGRRLRCVAQINVTNLFDESKVVTLRRASTGAIFIGRQTDAPRKITLTNTIIF